MDSNQANEQLRVIRSLMERATVYRAISAPTALVGGILSIVASIILTRADMMSGADLNRFIGGWLLVLVVTLVANTWFIHLKARREGGKIFSSGLRLAIRSALPVLLIAAALTTNAWRDDDPVQELVLPIVWMCCYGLALLSTATFAPRSLIVLGWIFLASGLITGGILDLDPNHRIPLWPSLLMGVSFGAYHLIYAACTWPRKHVANAAAQLSIE